MSPPTPTDSIVTSIASDADSALGYTHPSNEWQFCPLQPPLSDGIYPHVHNSSKCLKASCQHTPVVIKRPSPSTNCVPPLGSPGYSSSQIVHMHRRNKSSISMASTISTDRMHRPLPPLPLDIKKPPMVSPTFGVHVARMPLARRAGSSSSSTKSTAPVLSKAPSQRNNSLKPPTEIIGGCSSTGAPIGLYATKDEVVGPDTFSDKTSNETIRQAFSITATPEGMLRGAASCASSICDGIVATTIVKAGSRGNKIKVKPGRIPIKLDVGAERVDENTFLISDVESIASPREGSITGGGESQLITIHLDMPFNFAPFTPSAVLQAGNLVRMSSTGSRRSVRSINSSKRGFSGFDFGLGMLEQEGGKLFLKMIDEGLEEIKDGLGRACSDDDEGTQADARCSRIDEVSEESDEDRKQSADGIKMPLPPPKALFSSKAAPLTVGRRKRPTLALQTSEASLTPPVQIDPASSLPQSTISQQPQPEPALLQPHGPPLSRISIRSNQVSPSRSRSIPSTQAVSPNASNFKPTNSTSPVSNSPASARDDQDSDNKSPVAASHTKNGSTSSSSNSGCRSRSMLSSLFSELEILTSTTSSEYSPASTTNSLDLARNPPKPGDPNYILPPHHYASMGNQSQQSVSSPEATRNSKVNKEKHYVSGCSSSFISSPSGMESGIATPDLDPRFSTATRFQDDDSQVESPLGHARTGGLYPPSAMRTGKRKPDMHIRIVDAPTFASLASNIPTSGPLIGLGISGISCVPSHRTGRRERLSRIQDSSIQFSPIAPSSTSRRSRRSKQSKRAQRDWGAVPRSSKHAEKFKTTVRSSHMSRTPPQDYHFRLSSRRESGQSGFDYRLSTAVNVSDNQVDRLDPKDKRNPIWESPSMEQRSIFESPTTPRQGFFQFTTWTSMFGNCIGFRTKKSDEEEKPELTEVEREREMRLRDQHGGSIRKIKKGLESVKDNMKRQKEEVCYSPVPIPPPAMTIEHYRFG